MRLSIRNISRFVSLFPLKCSWLHRMSLGDPLFFKLFEENEPKNEIRRRSDQKPCIPKPSELPGKRPVNPVRENLCQPNPGHKHKPVRLGFPPQTGNPLK